MNKTEWKDSTSSLRKLIREVLKQPQEGTQIDRRCEYKFGLVYNQQYRYFHIWNGKTKNTIATIKLSGKRAFVRYRKNSWYADIIRGITVPNRKVIFVESKDLSRHRDMVRSRIQSRVEVAMADFLVRRTPVVEERSSDRDLPSNPEESMTSLPWRERMDILSQQGGRCPVETLTIPLREEYEALAGTTVASPVLMAEVEVSGLVNTAQTRFIAEMAQRLQNQLHITYHGNLETLGDWYDSERDLERNDNPELDTFSIYDYARQFR